MDTEPLTPISLSQHGHQGWKKAVGFGFARRIATVPLAIGEITRVAQSIPVVFTYQAGGWVPLAILGPVKGTSVYVDSAGRWRGTAVPGSLRMYPFGLEPDSGRLSLWSSFEPSPIGEHGVMPFFSSDRLSNELLTVQRFLERWSEGITKGGEVLTWLSRRDVLAPWQVPGMDEATRALQITELFRVDVERLYALGDKALLGLLRAGHLQWLHAHLASLEHADRFKTMARDLVTPFGDRPARQKESDKSTDILSAIVEDLGDAEL